MLIKFFYGCLDTLLILICCIGYQMAKICIPHRWDHLPNSSRIDIYSDLEDGLSMQLFFFRLFCITRILDLCVLYTKLEVLPSVNYRFKATVTGQVSSFSYWSKLGWYGSIVIL